MNKLLLALGLILISTFGGLRLLGETDSTPHLLPLSVSEARAWEHRLRAYHRARARIQLNDQLDSDAQRLAIQQLQIDYFDDTERERLRQHERDLDRDRQQQAVDL
ncbi:MAG TPA: lipase secretion chaperone [Pseudomonas sp.]|nr:lipase secretion chaperone [Pseudomonas sp.]